MTMQAPRSLNYIVKRKEADRIDRENMRIMERIIRQGPSMSKKQLEREYVETTIRFKRMKQKTLTVSVEKIVERKKRHLNEIKSSLLPLISQSTKNQVEPNIMFQGSRNIFRQGENLSEVNRFKNGGTQFALPKSSLAGTSTMVAAMSDERYQFLGS